MFLDCRFLLHDFSLALDANTKSSLYDVAINKNASCCSDQFQQFFFRVFSFSFSFFFLSTNVDDDSNYINTMKIKVRLGENGKPFYPIIINRSDSIIAAVNYSVRSRNWQLHRGCNKCIQFNCELRWCNFCHLSFSSLVRYVRFVSAIFALIFFVVEFHWIIFEVRLAQKYCSFALISVERMILLVFIFVFLFDDGKYQIILLCKYVNKVVSTIIWITSIHFTSAIK